MGKRSTSEHRLLLAAVPRHLGVEAAPGVVGQGVDAPQGAGAHPTHDEVIARTKLMVAAMRPCSYPLCSQAGTRRGRCEEHYSLNQVQIKARTPERRSIYLSAQWRGTRRTVLERDPFCRCDADCCPDGCTDTSVDVDHVRPLKLILAEGGDPFDPGACQGLSHRCHSRKTLSELR